MRYGICNKQHAEKTIKSAIRSWASERDHIDGVLRGKKEIEEIVEDMWVNTIKNDKWNNGDNACTWVTCLSE
jgi:hypothetical protein